MRNPFRPPLTNRHPSRRRLTLWLWLTFQFVGLICCEAFPIAGTNTFTRPLNGNIAISTQAILGADTDTALVPIFISNVDSNSANGGVILRTNDWLYYQTPTNPVATDSFHYVLSNLIQQTTTGTVTIVAVTNFAATNFLKISTVESAGQKIEFFGNVGSYNIQSSADLKVWQTLGARLAWPAGYFSFSDIGAGPAVQKRFYRTATGALAPVITNYQATGTANVQVDFNLGVESGTNPPYPATILSLPVLGYLFQDDGFVLTNTPATVTGTNGSLHYFAPVNGYGTNYASFSYKLTRPADGLDSLPATYQISLAQDVPSFTTPKPTFPEDVGGFIHLTGTDPDLRYSSNTLQFQLLFQPVIGKLYQVNQDGTVNSNHVMADFESVSNNNGLVYYQPPPLRFGTPFDSITVQADNAFGGNSGAILLPINVSFVNHAPMAGPAEGSAAVDFQPISITLEGNDPDFNAASICFPTLPARGQMYTTFPGNSQYAITASNNCFSLSGEGQFQIFFNSDSIVNGTLCYPDASDIGSPYATATYVITDADGASATNTITFNILPITEPFPIPAGPASYTNLLNSNIVITLTATNSMGMPDNNDAIFILETLPSHGTLELGTTALSQVPATLPQNVSLTYVPNAGYYSSRDGLDSFGYHSSDFEDEMNCNANIALQIIAPPVLTNSTGSVIVTVDANGNVTAPGVFKGVAITPRDVDTNALMQLTVTGTFPGSAPYGYFVLNATNGLSSIQTNGPVSINFTGTTAALNAALSAGINYYSTPSSTTGTIKVTLNDLDATGLGTNTSPVSFSVLYFCPDCGLNQ